MFAANKTQHCRYISASHEPIEARCMCQSPLCRALDFLKHTFIKCSRVVCSCCPRLLFKGCRGRERGREKETKPYRMNHGVCQQFNLPACRSLLHHVLIVRDRAVYITRSHFGMALHRRAQQLVCDRWRNCFLLWHYKTSTYPTQVVGFDDSRLL